MTGIPENYKPERTTCALTNTSNPSYVLILDNDSVNTIPRKVLFVDAEDKPDTILDIIPSSSTLSNGSRRGDSDGDSASDSDTLSDKSYHSEGDEKQSAYLAATVDTEKRVLLFSWYGKHPVQLNHERKFSGILRDGDAVAFGKNHDHEYVCEFSPPQKKIPRDIDPDFPDWDFKETRRVKKKRNEGKQKKIKRKFPK